MGKVILTLNAALCAIPLRVTIETMVNRLIVLPFLFVFISCNTKESVVNYNELIKVMEANPKNDLCYWYYDSLQSQRDEGFYFIDYICFPSKDYSGSSFKRKVSVKVSKTAIVVSNGLVGEITAKDIIEK